MYKRQANVNVTLTLIIFAVIPIMLLCSIWFNKRMRRAFKMGRVVTGDINAQVEDSLLGVRVVKSFANEAIEEEKFNEGNAGFLNIKKMMYRYMEMCIRDRYTCTAIAADIKWKSLSAPISPIIRGKEHVKCVRAWAQALK